MHYDISFPHLGIHLEHVGKTISVFGFEIAYYGIIIGTAILLGFVIATSEAKRTGQDPESYLDMGMFGVVFGIIGARLYYVLFSWDMYKDNLLEIFEYPGRRSCNLRRCDCSSTDCDHCSEDQAFECAPDF